MASMDNPILASATDRIKQTADLFRQKKSFENEIRTEYRQFIASVRPTFDTIPVADLVRYDEKGQVKTVTCNGKVFPVRIVKNKFLDENVTYSTMLGLNLEKVNDSQVYFQWKKNNQWTGQTLSNILQTESSETDLLTSQVSHCIEILKKKNSLKIIVGVATTSFVLSQFP